jgi:hypothetical protein
MKKKELKHPDITQPYAEPNPALTLEWALSGGSPGGQLRRKLVEEWHANEKASKAKPKGTETRFADVEVGQQLIFRHEGPVYTKTEPVKITTGAHKGKISEISYELKGETRRTVCSDPECIVWVVGSR